MVEEMGNSMQISKTERRTQKKGWFQITGWEGGGS